MIARQLGTVIAAALLATVCTGALAQEGLPPEDAAPADDAKPFTGRTAYISAGGVFAIENVDHAVIEGDASNSGGYDLRVGYFVHEMAAVEFQWQAMTNFNISPDSPGDPDEDSVEAQTAQFNGRFSPLSGRFQPYALMGMGWLGVQTDRENGQPDIQKGSFAMRFGAGLSTFITERLGVTLEAAYVLPLTGDLAHGESFDLIPISLTFFFRFS